jgi:hypothetical protein
MRATFSIMAAAVVSAVVLAAPAGAATADHLRVAVSPSAVRLANGCPDRPRIHVRRYGQRGGGAPTRCPPQG